MHVFSVCPSLEILKIFMFEAVLVHYIEIKAHLIFFIKALSTILFILYLYFIIQMVLNEILVNNRDCSYLMPLVVFQ